MSARGSRKSVVSTVFAIALSLMAGADDSHADPPGVTSGILPNTESITAVTTIKETGDLLLGLDTQLPTYARMRNGAIDRIVVLPLGDVPGMTVRPTKKKGARIDDIAVDGNGRAVFVGSYSQTDEDGVINRTAFIAQRRNYDAPVTLDWLTIPTEPRIDETYLYDIDIVGDGLVMAGKGELKGNKQAVPIFIELPDSTTSLVSTYRIDTGWYRAGVRGIETSGDGRWRVVGWRASEANAADHTWLADIEVFRVADANGQRIHAISGPLSETDNSPGFKGTAFGIASLAGQWRAFGRRVEPRRLWIEGVDIPEDYGFGGGGTVRGILSLDDGSVWVAGSLRRPDDLSFRKAFIAELTDAGLSEPRMLSDGEPYTMVFDMTRTANDRLALVGRTKMQGDKKWQGWWALVDPLDRDVKVAKIPTAAPPAITDALQGSCTLTDRSPLTPGVSGLACFDGVNTIETVLALDAPDRIGFALRATGGVVGMTIFDADGLPHGSRSAEAGTGAYLVAYLEPGEYRVFLFGEKGASYASLHPIAGAKPLPLAAVLDSDVRDHIEAAGYRLPAPDGMMSTRTRLAQRIADFEAGSLLVPTGTISDDVWADIFRTTKKQHVTDAVAATQRAYRLMKRTVADTDLTVFGSRSSCGATRWINRGSGTMGVCYRDIDVGPKAGFFVGAFDEAVDPAIGVQWIPETDDHVERFLIGRITSSWQHADITRDAIDLDLAIQKGLLPAKLSRRRKDAVFRALFNSTLVDRMIERAR